METGARWTSDVYVSDMSVSVCVCLGDCLLLVSDVEHTCPQTCRAGQTAVRIFTYTDYIT